MKKLIAQSVSKPPIDSHVHVWCPPDGAMDERLAAAGSIESLLSVLDRHNVERAVAIQPGVHAGDHEYLLKSVASARGRLAAVARVDHQHWEAVLARTEGWAESGSIVGLRLPLIQSPPRFLEKVAGPLWSLAAAMRLPLCILMNPHHVATVVPLIEEYPDVTVVVDHLGRPDMGKEPFQVSVDRIAGLAVYPHILVKLSAIGAVASVGASEEEIVSAAERLIGSFGIARVMWGSDYPPCLQYGPYGLEFRTLSGILLRQLGDAERLALFRENAERIFFPDLHASGPE